MPLLGTGSHRWPTIQGAPSVLGFSNRTSVEAHQVCAWTTATGGVATPRREDASTRSQPIHHDTPRDNRQEVHYEDREGEIEPESPPWLRPRQWSRLVLAQHRRPVLLFLATVGGRTTPCASPTTRFTLRTSAAPTTYQEHIDCPMMQSVRCKHLRTCTTNRTDHGRLKPWRYGMTSR